MRSRPPRSVVRVRARSMLPLASVLACGTSTPEVVSDGAVAALEPGGEVASFANCTAGWCLIRAGTFVMGAPRDEFGAGATIDVQVTVTLTHDYWMQQTELTQADWVKAGFPNPSGSDPHGRDCLQPDCPVGNIRWIEAAAYANHLSRRDGLPECYALTACSGAPGADYRCAEVALTVPTNYACHGYRIPTEAEWEYAARAGTTTAFYSGPIRTLPDRLDCADDPNLGPIGWYCSNSGKSTRPVARKAPNAFGLYDMSGNAAEWVYDWMAGSGYGPGPNTDPDGYALIPGESKGRVARGGSAALPSIIAKSSYRYGIPADSRSPTFGVRLVRLK
ncbi:MAG: formylglycine-generating enzyme family protein [Myxococcales bacterium]|nr:formylglycine-generating enzyme family protein [Myxococcales bacterium]